MTIFDIIGEGIDIHKLAGSSNEKIRMVKEALEDVGLIPPEEFFNKYPHQLSGGQRQRVAIASTLVLHPDLIIADEPVSMLDASLRWGITELMMNLRRRYGLTYIFILHDLALAKYISTHLAILYLGQIVELGTSYDVIKKPMHPYIRALMSVVPSLRKIKSEGEKIILKGEIPNPIDLPTGCRFHPRCPYASPICERERPELMEVEQNHYVRCIKI
jgi:peptide/nickel transport system ATP-binding protein